MPILRPERYFTRITRIDVQRDLIDAGLTHVLLDVDNTILTRDTHEVPDDVAAWLAEARAAGVKFCMVSNNFHEGVLHLAKRLDLPIVARAVKPLPFAIVKARRLIGGTRRDTVAIGDQLITDVFGAHFLRMPAIMLQPLVETDLWHTLLLRHVEHVIMGDRQPEC